MSEGAEAGAYVLDAEAFAALRRLVVKLRGDGVLAGDERRNIANRMNALLQKAQPQRTVRGRQKASPDCWQEGLLAQGNQPFGKM